MKKLIALLCLLTSCNFLLLAQEPGCTNYSNIDFYSFYGNEICDYGSSFIELIVITNGPPAGEFYDVIINGTDGSQSFGFADDYGYGFAELFPNPVIGCEAAEVSFEMIIACFYTGTVLEVVDLGTYTVYPQLTLDIIEPGCAEGENGSVSLVALDGTVCEGPIEGTPGVSGDCENQQPGTITYEFNPFPNAVDCFFNFNGTIESPCTDLEFGCTDPTACNFSESAVCDDGSCTFEEVCCPRPIAETLPAGICSDFYYPGESVCISFNGDITLIDIYSMFLFSDNGGYGFIDSFDPATNEICFQIDIFYYGYDFCQPFEDNFTLEYFCFDSYEFITIDLGSVIVYPPPFAFEVFSQPSPECGGAPELFPPECGELIIGEITPPINECENLTPGILSYTIDPGFDISNAPECFTSLLAAELPIPPCEEGCECEGVFCGGTCTNLIVSSDQLPDTQCAYNGQPITISISGQGATTATYFGDIIDSNGNFVANFFHQPGDPTNFDIFPFFYSNGCTPETFALTYQLFCADDFSLLATDTLGSITVYPDSFLYFPDIIEGEPCGAGPTIIPAPCGTIVTDPDPIPNPECGEEAMDQTISWFVDYGFDTTDAPPCFVSDISGEFTVFACTEGPGDPCFVECLGEGVLDENCLCVVENSPQIAITDSLISICEGESVFVDANLIGNIPPGQFFILEVVDQNGFFINSIFIDNYTTFPLPVEIFDFNYGSPCETRESSYTFSIRCFYDFSVIGNPVVVGPVTIYPSPFNYLPFIDPAISCESEPIILLNDFCPATLEILETIPPVDDCDAPEAGYVSWQVLPAFDTTNAPACFTEAISGQAPIPPCLIDCPCDGTFCQGVCMDVSVIASGLPTLVCPDDGFQYELEVTGLGADIGNYFVLTFDNNGFNVSFDIHNPGDPTIFSPFVFPFVQGCEPEEQVFTYEIQCIDGNILASDTIGSVTVYPSPFNFFPNITPSIECIQDLMIDPGFCGTVVIDPDPIPVPGCGGADATVNWSVDFGFDYPPNCYSYPIEGTETVFACDGVPGEPCDDFNPCTINDTFDDNCSCIGEGPTAVLDAPLPTSLCVQDNFTISVTVDQIPDPDGLFLLVNDQFGNGLAFAQFLPGGPLTINVDIFPFLPLFCEPADLELFLELRCPATFGIIGTQVSLGTVAIYPDLNAFIPQIEPAIDCGIEPIFIPGQCGTISTMVTQPDPPACPAGNNGFVDWMINPGFDVAAAPACFDISLLSGQEPILACEDCNGNCEDEISGTVIAPMGCSIAGVTVTIYDSMGNAVSTLTTDANGVYDSSPVAFPCGNYTAELTANIPTCYSNANGETGPKPFTIDDDPNNNDTDGTDFESFPPTCNFSVQLASFDCFDNGTLGDPNDDTADITFTVMSNGSNWTSNVPIGGVTSGSDGMMLSEVGLPAGTNLVVVFTSVDDPNCIYTLDFTVPDCVAQIPTLSEWGLITLLLLLMSYGSIAMVGIGKLVGITTHNLPMPFNTNFNIPFNSAIYRKALMITGLLVAIGFALSIAVIDK